MAARGHGRGGDGRGGEGRGGVGRGVGRGEGRGHGHGRGEDEEEGVPRVGVRGGRGGSPWRPDRLGCLQSCQLQRTHGRPGVQTKTGRKI